MRVHFHVLTPKRQYWDWIKNRIHLDLIKCDMKWVNDIQSKLIEATHELVLNIRCDHRHIWPIKRLSSWDIHHRSFHISTNAASHWHCAGMLFHNELIWINKCVMLKRMQIVVKFVELFAAITSSLLSWVPSLIVVNINRSVFWLSMPKRKKGKKVYIY